MIVKNWLMVAKVISYFPSELTLNKDNKNTMSTLDYSIHQVKKK